MFDPAIPSSGRVAGARFLRPALPAVAVVALFAGSTAALGDDWPTFLGRGQDATSDEPLGLPWPAEGPPVLWKIEIRDSYAAPMVARGAVYVFDRVDDHARLRRLDALTGEEVWSSGYPTEYVDQFDYSGGPRASPVFDPGVEGAEGVAGRDRVYAFGVDGRLRCHDAASGEVIWEIDTQQEFGVVQNFFGVASTPVIFRDVLWTMIGGSPEGDWDNHTKKIEPNGTGLVAFDKLTGEVRLRTVDDLASYSSPVLRELGGEQRLLSFARSGLWVVDPATGEVLASHPWRADKAYSVNASTPLVRDDEIFITESYEVGGALLRWVEGDGTTSGGEQAARLEVVWDDADRRRDQRLAAHWNTPVVHDGHLYGSHGQNSGPAELRCVAWDTGEVRWRHHGLNRSNALLADGHLVVLGEYGELVLVEATPEEYREKGRWKPVERRGDTEVPLFRHPAWNAPVLANGVLYVTGADRLVAFDLGGGAERPATEGGSAAR